VLCDQVFDIDTRNPCVGIKLFPVDINLKYIPSEQEITLVRDALDNEECFLFDFIEQTGCRINEALRLRFEGVQEELVTLWIRKAKNSNLTPRRIPIPECLIGKRGQDKFLAAGITNPNFLEDMSKNLD